MSLSAESETPLGFAQHLFFLKIGGFYPPIHFLLLATSGGEPPLPRRGIARQVSLDTCKRSLLTRSTKFPMNYRLADALPQDTQSLDQAFSKACSFQRQSLWSLSAESETPLGFAQHLFFLKIGGFYPPIHFLLLATSGGEPPLPRRVIARQVSLDICKKSLLTRLKKLPLS